LLLLFGAFIGIAIARSRRAQVDPVEPEDA